MSLSRVALIGSCVTRDMWEMLGRSPDQLFFLARTSLLSLTSPPPLDANVPDYQASSRFERRSLEADIQKTGLADMAAFAPDVILIDLIDERFDALLIDKSFIQFSHEFQLAGGHALPWARRGARLDRLESLTTWLWMQAARQFVNILRNDPILSRARVILHRAPWAQRCTDAQSLSEQQPIVAASERYEITFGKIVFVRDYEFLMRIYYDVFAMLMPEAWIAAVPEELHVAADRHIWGKAPFHYVREYYTALGRSLAAFGVSV